MLGRLTALPLEATRLRETHHMMVIMMRHARALAHPLSGAPFIWRTLSSSLSSLFSPSLPSLPPVPPSLPPSLPPSPRPRLPPPPLSRLLARPL